jgi:hypothetical protein
MLRSDNRWVARAAIGCLLALDAPINPISWLKLLRQRYIDERNSQARAQVVAKGDGTVVGTITDPGLAISVGSADSHPQFDPRPWQAFTSGQESPLTRPFAALSDGRSPRRCVAVSVRD